MIEKSIKYKDKKEIKKPVVQGGVENYLGRQPEVQAPRKWQSAPDKPSTELAYITEAEKKLIMKANLHGGLERGPNMGPSGIMSLDSFGDIGGAGAGGADTSAGGAANEGAGFSGRGAGEFGTDRQSQKAFEDRIANQKAQLQIAERKQAEALGYDERENIADMYSVDPLQRLYMQGVPDVNIPGLMGMGLNLTQPLRNIGLRKNIDYFRELGNIQTKGYSKDLEGYQSYMQDRLSGKIDAAGNPIGGTGEGGGDNQSQLIQQAISNPLQNTTIDSLQGGVGALYAQYMKNLGYTL